MIVKTLTLHSLTYLVGITSSVAVHQVIPTSVQGNPISNAAIVFEVANRSVKSDRLPLQQAQPQANEKAPATAPAKIAPNQKLKPNCKPPIDVLGRCFAHAGANGLVA